MNEVNPLVEVIHNGLGAVLQTLVKGKVQILVVVGTDRLVVLVPLSELSRDNDFVYHLAKMTKVNIH